MAFQVLLQIWSIATKPHLFEAFLAANILVIFFRAHSILEVPFSGISLSIMSVVTTEITESFIIKKIFIQQTAPYGLSERLNYRFNHRRKLKLAFVSPFLNTKRIDKNFFFIYTTPLEMRSKTKNIYYIVRDVKWLSFALFVGICIW